MTAPLVPPEVDLRGMQFIPLDTVRLLDSDLFALSTGDEFKAAVALWCKAWLQVPAASLPDDERVLAHLSGAGSRWRKVRSIALRGFVRCDDGRLYHPVIVEKALEAWEHRKAQRAKAAKRWEGAKPEPGKAVADAAGDAAALPVADAAAHATAMQGTGTVKGQLRDRDNNPTPSASETPRSKTLAPRAKKPPDDAPKTNAVWQAYSDAYRERYGVDPTRNAKANGLLSGFVDRIGAEEAPAVAAFFLQSNRQLYVAATHALDLLIRDAEGLRTAWVTHRHGTESEARMADKTQGRGNVFGKLIEEVKSGAKG